MLGMPALAHHLATAQLALPRLALGEPEERPTHVITFDATNGFHVLGSIPKHSVVANATIVQCGQEYPGWDSNPQALAGSAF